MTFTSRSRDCGSGYWSIPMHDLCLKVTWLQQWVLVDPNAWPLPQGHVIAAVGIGQSQRMTFTSRSRDCSNWHWWILMHDLYLKVTWLQQWALVYPNAWPLPQGHVIAAVGIGRSLCMTFASRSCDCSSGYWSIQTHDLHLKVTWLQQWALVDPNAWPLPQGHVIAAMGIGLS
jgi:hypothetical protein